MNGFTIKINYDWKWQVNMSIDGAYQPNDVLLTLAQATGNVIKEMVEPESVEEAFNFLMKTVKAKLS